MPKPLSQAYGFTLIELIIVVMVVGIISVTVMLQWPATSLNLNYEARRVLDDVRYTQALSMTTGLRYRWVKTSANTYQILNEAGTAIVLPSGGTQVTLSSGIVLGALGNLPNDLVAFSSLGSPYIDSTIPGTALAATASIPISGGGQTRIVQISPETGHGVLQ